MERFEKAALFIIFVFACLVSPEPIYEKTQTFEKVMQCLGDPCTVTYNPGGNLKEFERASDAINSSTIRMVAIDGVCGSACTVAADRLRQYGKICITPRAVMGFHQGYEKGTGRRFVPEYSADIYTLVSKAGGFPEPRNVNYFYYASINRLWPTCWFNPPLPHPDPRKQTAAK